MAARRGEEFRTTAETLTYPDGPITEAAMNDLTSASDKRALATSPEFREDDLTFAMLATEGKTDHQTVLDYLADHKGVGRLDPATSERLRDAMERGSGDPEALRETGQLLHTARQAAMEGQRINCGDGANYSRRAIDTFCARAIEDGYQSRMDRTLPPDPEERARAYGLMVWLDRKARSHADIRDEAEGAAQAIEEMNHYQRTGEFPAWYDSEKMSFTAEADARGLNYICPEVLELSVENREPLVSHLEERLETVSQFFRAGSKKLEAELETLIEKLRGDTGGREVETGEAAATGLRQAEDLLRRAQAHDLRPAEFARSMMTPHADPQLAASFRHYDTSDYGYSLHAQTNDFNKGNLSAHDPRTAAERLEAVYCREMRDAVTRMTHQVEWRKHNVAPDLGGMADVMIHKNEMLRRIAGLPEEYAHAAPKGDAVVRWDAPDSENWGRVMEVTGNLTDLKPLEDRLSGLRQAIGDDGISKGSLEHSLATQAAWDLDEARYQIESLAHGGGHRQSAAAVQEAMNNNAGDYGDYTKGTPIHRVMNHMQQADYALRLLNGVQQSAGDGQNSP